MAGEVRGLEDLQKALGGLSAQMRAQFLTDGLVAGANVIRAGMQTRAPRRTGFLNSHIEIQVSVASGVGTAKIGPQRDAFYGGILQQGTKAYPISPKRARGRRGKAKALKIGNRFVANAQRKPMPPRPFMTDALTQDSPRAIQVASQKIFDRIDAYCAAVPKGGA